MEREYYKTEVLFHKAYGDPLTPVHRMYFGEGTHVRAFALYEGGVAGYKAYDKCGAVVRLYVGPYRLCDRYGTDILPITDDDEKLIDFLHEEVESVGNADCLLGDDIDYLGKEDLPYDVRKFFYIE